MYDVHDKTRHDMSKKKGLEWTIRQTDDEDCSYLNQVNNFNWL